MGENSLKKWEGRIYNTAVREALKSGEDFNLSISESWADSHYIMVWAYTEAHAREQLEHRYHKIHGFVVADIIIIDD